jgi:hypothetical protein
MPPLACSHGRNQCAPIQFGENIILQFSVMVKSRIAIESQKIQRKTSFLCDLCGSVAEYSRMVLTGLLLNTDPVETGAAGKNSCIGLGVGWVGGSDVGGDGGIEAR